VADKGEFEVKRDATIPASRAAVYALLVDFHRWREWSPWEDLDPDLSRTYSGPDAGVGAVYEWSGNRKAGSGRMEITDAVESSKVQIALQFLKPFKSSSTTTFQLVERDGATDVTWRMVGPKTLMTKVMGIFTSMDKMVGKDFEKGLTRLKDAATSSA
jgi:uncharacterized protein YndB with AHSA1/START domain